MTALTTNELLERMRKIHALATFPQASGFDYIRAMAEIARLSGPYRLQTLTADARGAVEIEVSP